MKSLNQITLVGNLGKDAEVTKVGEHTVTKFSIATTDGWGKNETTNWHNCVAWNKDKVAPYLTKGSKVGITGRLEYREWTAKDGMKRSAPEIVANDILLLGEKKEQSRESQITSFESQDGTGGSDELPF